MNRAQDKRTWVAGGAVAAVAVAGAGWFLGINPVLTDTSDTKAQTQTVEQQNQAAHDKLRVLAGQRVKLKTLTAQLAQTLTELPLDNDLPQFTRQLSGDAAASNVRLDSVAFGSITSAATAATTGTGTTGAPAAPTGPVSILVTVNSTGSAAHQLAFLRAIQVAGPRRALVTSTSLAATDTTTAHSTGRTTMTTSFTVFANPKSAADRAELLKLLTAK